MALSGVVAKQHAEDPSLLMPPSRRNPSLVIRLLYQLHALRSKHSHISFEASCIIKTTSTLQVHVPVLSQIPSVAAPSSHRMTHAIVSFELQLCYQPFENVV